jgi:hypothetical protein
MRHRSQSGSAKQIPLAFNPMASPDSASVLRTAYTRLELSRRLSFEQAMANRVYAIGVRNLADAMARRGACANSTKASSSPNAIARNMQSLSDGRLGVGRYGAETGER